jgi:hypothetical protein
MFEEQKAREGTFGYVQVHGPHQLVIEMPDPYLVKMLTSRKRSRGEEIVREFQGEVAKVVRVVEDRLSAINFEENVLQIFVDEEMKNLNPEFREAARTRGDLLVRAAAVGLLLGRLDPTHVGENPPVALGAHKRALGELCERLFAVADDVPEVVSSMCGVVAQSAFFMSRRVTLRLSAAIWG